MAGNDPIAGENIRGYDMAEIGPKSQPEGGFSQDG